MQRRLGRTVATCALLALAAAACCKTTGLEAVCGTSVTPSTLDFGAVALGQSPAQTLTVSNSSSGPLTIVSAVASGDSSFQVETFPSTDIQAGTSFQIQVTFDPTTPGTHTATLLITTNDNCKSPTTTVTLTGVGTDFAVSLSPSSLAFGCEVVGGQAAGQSVTVTNDSNPPEAESVTISRSRASDFQLSGGSSTFVLAPGASVSVSILFAPTGLGAKQESLDVTVCELDGGACPPATSIALSGDGAATTLVATPDPVSFAFLPVGQEDSQLVTIQAVSSSDAGGCALPATVAQPKLLFGDAGFSLALDGGWPATLSPPQSFSLLVDFESADGGPASDVAQLPFTVDGLTQQTLDIPLYAQVVLGPCQLTVTPPAVSFGAVTIGQTVTEPLSVCNYTSAFCDLSSIAISQNDAANEFIVSDAGIQAPTAFAPSQCETVEVAFTTANTTPPLTRDGTLTLTTEEIGADAGVSLIAVPLSATTANWAYPGQLLVAGGNDATNTTLSSAEVYDGTSGTWTTTAFGLTTPRAFHMATLLASGQVLIAGGQSGGTFLTSSELFNPGTGLFQATTGQMDYAPGTFPTASLLPSGQVLIAGGGSTVFSASSDLYDPATETWSPTGSLLYGLNNTPWGVLPSGQVLVADGALQCCYATEAPVSELYDPGTGTWSASGPMLEGVIWNSGVVLSSGDFLVVGGMNTSGNATADCELYDHTQGTWSMTGSLQTARLTNGMVALLPSGQVLVAGGSTVSGGVTGTTELYDPTSGGWSPTGSLTTARSNATMSLLPNGKVLVAGGSDGTQTLASCELYDPSTGLWSPTGSLSTPRLYHSATLLQ